jgi:hypothetical protein
MATVQQDLQQGDTAATGPSPVVSVPFQWSDPTSVSLFMENQSIFSSLPNWTSYAAAAAIVYALMFSEPEPKRKK